MADPYLSIRGTQTIPFNTTWTISGRQTKTSVSLSLATKTDNTDTCSFRAYYRPQGETSWTAADATSAALGNTSDAERLISSITGLTSGTRYEYTIQFRLSDVSAWLPLSDSTVFWTTSDDPDAGYVGEFETLPASTSDTFTLCFTSDEHLRLPVLTTPDNALNAWTATLGYIADNEAPLCLFNLGDLYGFISTFMHDQGESRETSYRARNAMRPILDTTAFYRVFGNHDGKMGWTQTPLAPAADTRYIQRWMFESDKTFWLNPNDATAPNVTEWKDAESGTHVEGDLNAAPLEDFYTFVIGSLQVWALNKYPYGWATYLDNNSPNTTPSTESGWTLGTTQKAWFKSTYAASTAQWRLILLHSFPGGYDNYGRAGIGGILTSNTEWADELHPWLRTYHPTNGGVLVMRGHDHVFEYGEQQDIKYAEEASPRSLIGNVENTRGYNTAASEYFNRTYGYGKLTVSPASMVLEFIKIAEDDGDPDAPALTGNLLGSPEILFTKTIAPTTISLGSTPSRPSVDITVNNTDAGWRNVPADQRAKFKGNPTILTLSGITSSYVD